MSRRVQRSRPGDKIGGEAGLRTRWRLLKIAPLTFASTQGYEEKPRKCVSQHGDTGPRRYTAFSFLQRTNSLCVSVSSCPRVEIPHLSHGSANTCSIPPLMVCCGRSLIALTNPSAAVGSRASRFPATIAPAHPPTPENTATYCLPSGPLYVIGCPMIPEPVLNCHSGWPLLACTALNHPSIVP